MKYERESEAILEFQNVLLKYLEPMKFKKNVLLQGQKESFDQVIFLMEGRIDIGYNCEFFLFENGIKSAKEVSRKMIQRKATRKKLSTLLFGNKKEKQQDTQRFQFPHSVGPGQAIGLFELSYERKTQFVYRISRQTNADGYFMRLSNWHKFREETQEEFAEAFKSFQKYVLADYINKIYLPLQSDQEKLLQEEEDER